MFKQIVGFLRGTKKAVWGGAVAFGATPLVPMGAAAVFGATMPWWINALAVGGTVAATVFGVANVGDFFTRGKQAS